MTKAIENLIFSLHSKIPPIPENNLLFDKIEEIRNESNIIKQYQYLAHLISLIPTVIVDKEHSDKISGGIISDNNKHVQDSNPPRNSSENPKISDKSTKIEPNVPKIVKSFYTEERWQNWINQVKETGFTLDDHQKGAIFVTMEDDIVLACLKIIAKYDKNILSKEDAMKHISEVKEMVLKQIEPISEDIDIMIESTQISLMGVFASCECYIEKAFKKTRSLKPLIKKAIEAEKEENMGEILLNIAKIGANILSGGKIKDKDLEDIPEGLVAEWLDGIDSIRAAMIGDTSYRDDEPDEES
jgi:hypothetical protein